MTHSLFFSCRDIFLHVFTTFKKSKTITHRHVVNNKTQTPQAKTHAHASDGYEDKNMEDMIVWYEVVSS